jgi:hypothetical protein
MSTHERDETMRNPVSPATVAAPEPTDSLARASVQAVTAYHEAQGRANAADAAFRAAVHPAIWELHKEIAELARHVPGLAPAWPRRSTWRGSTRSTRGWTTSAGAARPGRWIRERPSQERTQQRRTGRCCSRVACR